jgi:hypothetical protein
VATPPLEGGRQVQDRTVQIPESFALLAHSVQHQDSTKEQVVRLRAAWRRPDSQAGNPVMEQLQDLAPSSKAGIPPAIAVPSYA